MNTSIHAPRDGAARLAEARRLVSDVEALLAGDRPGGATAGLARIGGLDHSGTAYAVVDQVGRCVDIGLAAEWWAALGPDRVAAGLLEALVAARMRAALVPFLLRRPGTRPDAGFLAAARGRIATADRLIDDGGDRRNRPAIEIITGPRGLFRLHVLGGRIERAERGPRRSTASDTDRLAADARDALTELTRVRAAARGCGVASEAGAARLR